MLTKRSAASGDEWTACLRSKLKDCVLEMTSAKYHVRISELLDVWKNSWKIDVMNRIMKIRRPDVSIVKESELKDYALE